MDLIHVATYLMPKVVARPFIIMGSLKQLWNIKNKQTFEDKFIRFSVEESVALSREVMMALYTSSTPSKKHTCIAKALKWIKKPRSTPIDWRTPNLDLSLVWLMLNLCYVMWALEIGCFVIASDWGQVCLPRSLLYLNLFDWTLVDYDSYWLVFCFKYVRGWTCSTTRLDISDWPSCLGVAAKIQFILLRCKSNRGCNLSLGGTYAPIDPYGFH